MKYISEKNTDETDAHTIDAIPGKIYLYARWIIDAGGGRARSDQTLQIYKSGPTYAGVCMINNPTELLEFSMTALN